MTEKIGIAEAVEHLRAELVAAAAGNGSGPQFEVGPEHVGKGGLVKDAAQYGLVEQRLREACAALGWTVRGWFDSPITGGDGNREFFIWAQAPDA